MQYRDISIAIQQGITYPSQIKGDDLQPDYQNRKQLLSHGKQYRVTLSPEVYFSVQIRIGSLTA